MTARRLAPLAAFLLAAALAAPAAFVIRNAPDQETDLASGVTTLPKGGTVEDAKRGYSITAGYIQLKEGDYLTARNATIRTRDAGEIRAASVDYRAATDRLLATGPLSYSFEDLKGLKADRAAAYLSDNLIVATGNVAATDPQVSATAAVLDADKRQLVLFGPYSFQGKGVNQKSSKADATLLVTLPKGSDKASWTTKVPTADLTAYRKLVDSTKK
ncbi:MAG TPA: hypothetical protein VNT60_06755 [Deinococcales bacterium]|nr:hypothetical protein [Deinococcales bacterium]